MIEIEFSAVACHAFSRRIGTFGELSRELDATIQDRNKNKIKWSFQSSQPEKNSKIIMTS